VTSVFDVTRHRKTQPFQAQQSGRAELFASNLRSTLALTASYRYN